MNNKLNIPQQVIVGQQKREDTYTKRLGFVAPIIKGKDPKSRLSWENWRDKKIAPLTVDNVPTEGFILNRNGGGRGSGWGWNDRQAFVRVWDPRGFEFEIGVANLLFILQESNSYKGKGLEGEFVYSWSGKDLVLLPAGSEEYKSSMGFTELKGMKFSLKDIKEGALYQTKNDTKVIYMGRYDWMSQTYWNSRDYNLRKEHIFYDIPTKKFVPLAGAKLAKVLDENVTPDWASLVDKLQKCDTVFVPGSGNVRVSKISNPANEIKRNGHIGTHRKLGNGFIKTGENQYSFVRLLQINEPTYGTYGSHDGAQKYQTGYKFTRIEITYPNNISVDNGSLNIKSSKQTKKEITEKELKELEFYNIEISNNTKSGPSKYRKILI